MAPDTIQTGRIARSQKARPTTTGAHATRPAVSFHGRGVFPEHKHRFPPLTIQLLEQDQRLLFQTQTALLVAVDDVEGVLAPVGVDVVFLERGGEDFVAGIFHADAEGFEDVDRGVVVAAAAATRVGRRGRVRGVVGGGGADFAGRVSSRAGHGAGGRGGTAALAGTGVVDFAGERFVVGVDVGTGG